ncbi:MAG: hypothetical protein RSB04_11330 [Gordonibacter sp.]|uniref:hypothetical protein n=1 Tax=Gordonibacter sp. TaxID=1968902 RepID=UPI002FCBD7ED
MRDDTVGHGCVGNPEKFWTQGAAALETRFDPSAAKSFHVGQDSEGWCGRTAEFLPASAEVIAHLDPLHINRAVVARFADKKAARQILDVLWDGGKQETACLLEIYRDLGIAHEKVATQVIGYPQGARELIDIESPSLGIIESENQHVYQARMDTVLRAWSRIGASDMARIHSRSHSKRSLPRMAREKWLLPKRRKSRNVAFKPAVLP